MPDTVTAAASHDELGSFTGRRVVFAYNLAGADPMALMARTDFEIVEQHTKGPVAWRGLVLVCPETSSEELDIEALRSAWHAWGVHEEVKVVLSWAEDSRPSHTCGDTASSDQIEITIYPSEFFCSFDRPCEALRELLEDTVPTHLDFYWWEEGGDTGLAERLQAKQVVIPVADGEDTGPRLEVVILEPEGDDFSEVRIMLYGVRSSDDYLP